MAKILYVNDYFDYSILHGSSCAFGVFDGVHLGHRFLIDQAIASGRKRQGKVIALTFDIDPDELLHPNRLKKLMSNQARLEMLASLSVDYVVVLPFTHEFAALSPQDFLKKTFQGHAPAYLHIGRDFRFGNRAMGTVHDLRKWAEANDVCICAHDLKSADKKPISATRIRLLLAEGKIDEANALLARPYFQDGVVQRGRGEGANMGFSTANLHIDPMLQTLAEGVYAAWVQLSDKRYKAAVSVGIAPTFAQETNATCEVHVLDFNGDLYDKPIRVEFITWLRPMMKFESTQALIKTVQNNITWVRENLH